MSRVGAFVIHTLVSFWGFSQKIGGKHERVMTTWPHCECALSPSLEFKVKDPQSSPRWSFVPGCIIPPGSGSCWSWCGRALTTCAANPPVEHGNRIGQRVWNRTFSDRSSSGSAKTTCVPRFIEVKINSTMYTHFCKHSLKFMSCKLTD